MASSQRTVDVILEQAEGAGTMTAKKMFGEYGLYLDGKMIALVCDDRLFVKPTLAGRLHIGEVQEEPPYPGAFGPKSSSAVTTSFEWHHEKARTFTIKPRRVVARITSILSTTAPVVLIAASMASLAASLWSPRKRRHRSSSADHSRSNSRPSLSSSASGSIGGLEAGFAAGEA